MSIVVPIRLWPNLHDHSRLHALRKEQARGRVTEVLEPLPRDARLLEEGEVAAVGVPPIERRADRRGEDQP